MKRDILLLEAKIKRAKRFQKEFDNHIKRLEKLLDLARKLRAR